jgi:hypothetical protein
LATVGHHPHTLRAAAGSRLSMPAVVRCCFHNSQRPRPVGKANFMLHACHPPPSQSPRYLRDVHMYINRTLSPDGQGSSGKPTTLTLQSLPTKQKARTELHSPPLQHHCTSRCLPIAGAIATGTCQVSTGAAVHAAQPATRYTLYIGPDCGPWPRTQLPRRTWSALTPNIAHSAVGTYQNPASIASNSLIILQIILCWCCDHCSRHLRKQLPAQQQAHQTFLVPQ